jgi:NAD(P)-dependent dehydrogenase (short-subunit alcohol dehydrogenase family)
MTEASPPKAALVTGAARRIGRAIAADLAAHGWRVAIHYRSSGEDARRLVAEIAASGGTATALAANLSDIDEVRALIPRCTESLGAPTCLLVNNASEFLLDTVTSLTPAEWDTHLDINLKAPVFLAQSLYLSLPEDAGGNVINICDQRVWRPTPQFFSYTISKAGLWTATQTLAQAMAPRVRVNAIGPGPVLKSVHQTDKDFADEQAATLLRRGPTLEEIAAAVRFILDTPSMTGQMIALDGGQHLS